MSVRWDVLGFGAVAVDDLVYVDRYPPPDTKKQVSATGRDGGGLTGTALVTAARLGARPAYCGVLGNDELSRWTIDQLQCEGVDCRTVLFRAEARPIHSVVIVDMSTGGRNIFFSMAGVIARPVEELTDDLIGSCRVLFVDHKHPLEALHAVAVAHRHGISVVGDLEDERAPGMAELIDQTDHLIVGIGFAGRVTGCSEPADMARALWHTGRACCAVTAGDRGCWYASRDGEVEHVPALEVRAVDTTGCGDVFHGAYAATIAGGESVCTAIRVATATAGLKATQPGGRKGIPTRETVYRLLAEYPWGAG